MMLLAADHRDPCPRVHDGRHPKWPRGAGQGPALRGCQGRPAHGACRWQGPVRRHARTAGLTRRQGPGLARPRHQRQDDVHHDVRDTPPRIPNDLWYAGVSTWAGSVLPAGMSGTMYPGSGNAVPTAWPADVSTESDGNKVWAPQLPVTPVDLRSNAGFGMPCAVRRMPRLLPGQVHRSARPDGRVQLLLRVWCVLLREHVPHQWFAQRSVVGLGATEGCTDDLDAVSYADYSAPFNHNQSGAGATLDLRWSRPPGRRQRHDRAPARALIINKRLVAPTETGVQSSAGVSIMSVNGVCLPGCTAIDRTEPAADLRSGSDAGKHPADAGGA